MGPRALAGLSLASVGVSLVGRSVAIDRGLAYDLPTGGGDPGSVRNDSLTKGTALSPPVSMIAVQAVAAAFALMRPSPAAERTLRRIGRTIVLGYAAEREVRRVIQPSNWDRVESPLAVAGIALAALIALP